MAERAEELSRPSATPPPAEVSVLRTTPVLAQAAAPKAPERTDEGRRGRSFLGAFWENRLGVVGLAIIAAVTAFCFLGPLVYHSDQIHANIAFTNLPPGAGRPLGTDANGFDILGRLMVGGQSALEISFAVAIVATSFGAIWGAVSGFAGGVLDAVMMRVVDVAIAVPAIFLLIYLASVFRPTVPLLIVVLSLLAWLGPARLIRGETLSLRTREFVDAVRVAGGRSSRVIGRHIIPNTIGTISVNATFQVADAIILLATLSFLGFGLPPPAVSWGGMLSQGTTYLLDGYWWEVYPAGIIVMVTVVAFNFVGDALRDTVDARLRVR
ncbi:MAG TPA: ABC transporter permease [Acidimicrobiales bacterium]|nr:ABC transporter permease [Acidimicrobiales bacterium]